MNPDGSAKREVTRGSRSDFDPAWSPDGRKIAFVRVFGTSRNPRQSVFVVNANGAGARALRPAGKQLVPAWQPLWR